MNEFPENVNIPFSRFVNDLKMQFFIVNNRETDDEMQ